MLSRRSTSCAIYGPFWYWHHTPANPACPIATIRFSLFISFNLKVISNSLLITLDAMTQKIAVQNPVVELDGDEMTRIIWKKIREEVNLPQYHSGHPLIVIGSLSCLTLNLISSTLTWDWNTEIRYEYYYPFCMTQLLYRHSPLSDK